MISLQPPLHVEMVSLLLCPLIPRCVLQVRRVTRARPGTGLQAQEGQERSRAGLDQEGQRESSGGGRWFCQGALFWKISLQVPPAPSSCPRHPHAAGLLLETAIILCAAGRLASLVNPGWAGLGWIGAEASNNVRFYYQILEQFYMYS